LSVRYKLSEIWRNVTKGYTKVNGAWSTMDVVYIKEGNTWRVAARRVPNVTGIAYDTAQTTLTGLGFSVTKSNTNSTDTTYESFSGGYVQSQVPGIDELADSNGTITLNTITYVVSPPSFSPGFGPFFFTPPPPPPPPPPGDFYVVPPPYGGGTPFGQAPSFGFYSPYGCILGTTKVATPNGLVAVQDLEIGDKLLSLDVEEIDTDEEKTNVHYWLSGTFTIKGMTETTVTRVEKLIVQDLVRINNRFYSFTHLILVQRDGEYEFVQAQFVKETDKVLASIPSNTEDPALDVAVPTFVPMEDLTRFHYKEGVAVYDISVEPYDVYFTENLLSHNK